MGATSLSLLGLLLSLLAAGSAQLVTSSPSFTLKFQNESVTLSCTTYAATDEASWTRETSGSDDKLPGSWANTHNRTAGVSIATLTLPKKKDEPELPYAGAYTCSFWLNKALIGNGTTVVRASPSPGKGKYLSHTGYRYVMQSQDKKEGESVTLTCSANGYPKPTYKWKVGADADGDINKDRMTAEGDTLTIKDLRYDDRNLYVCIADNGVDGQIHLMTLVRVKSKLAPLWPAVGILAEALIIVVIILLCEQRRKRKEAELEATENTKKQ